ncbi:hypothetical protein SLA2020_334870 [Shorea laevis]
MGFHSAASRPNSVASSRILCRAKHSLRLKTGSSTLAKMVYHGTDEDVSNAILKRTSNNQQNNEPLLVHANSMAPSFPFQCRTRTSASPVAPQTTIPNSWISLTHKMQEDKKIFRDTLQDGSNKTIKVILQKGSTTSEISSSKFLLETTFEEKKDTGDASTDATCRDQSTDETIIVSIDKANQEDILKNLSSIYGRALVVDIISLAKEVVGMLTTKYRDLVHACDTEVSRIDVKQETPVDHGEIICFSIYSGKDADFGNGKSCIWVDVLDGGGWDLLVEFAPFFEDPSIQKVWHNYSFDCHVIENYGLKVSGFDADTMHMARLWDSSRRTEGGYSLEALTSDYRVSLEVTHRKITCRKKG